MLLKNAKELKMLTMLALTKRCPPEGWFAWSPCHPLPSLIQVSHHYLGHDGIQELVWHSDLVRTHSAHMYDSCPTVDRWVMVMVSLVLICSNHKAPCWPMHGHHGPCCQVTLAKAASWLSAKSLSSFSRFDFHAAIELDEQLSNKYCANRNDVTWLFF